MEKEPVGCYSIFREWLASEGREELKGDDGGIYTPALIVWMMIFQRLHEGASLGKAVEEFSGGAFDELAGQCKRIREGRRSSSTGGYSQARKKLSLGIVSSIADNLYTFLSEDRAVREPKY